MVEMFLVFAAVRFTVYTSAEFDERVDGIVYATAAGARVHHRGQHQRCRPERRLQPLARADPGSGTVPGGLCGLFALMRRLERRVAA
jgi:hypothetical protein